MNDTGSNHEGPRPAGAVELLARDDVERKRFLKMAGKRMGAGAAATSLAAFIAACGSSSSSSSSAAGTSSAGSSSSSSAAAGTSSSSAAAGSSGDLGVVNYALTLEYLEAQFYAKVIKSGLFSGKNLSIIKTFGAEEAEHVAALHKVAMSLGKPAAKPVGKFPIHSAGQVTMLAGVVPRIGVRESQLTCGVASWNCRFEAVLARLAVNCSGAGPFVR